MKPSELKSFIKEAVREAIQEELKDILLEAVRAPKIPIIETSVGVGGYNICKHCGYSTKISYLKKEL
jgi:hypothetical protein